MSSPLRPVRLEEAEHSSSEASPSLLKRISAAGAVLARRQRNLLSAAEQNRFRPQLEEFEPRIVLSADALPTGLLAQEGWQYRTELTVAADQVDADLSNFPVLLTEASLPADVLARMQPDGDDLRFSSDANGDNLLPVEVVQSDDDQVQVYVNLPSVNANDDTAFYAWYGHDDPDVLAGPAADQVWSDYALVQHLDDPAVDSSPNDLHGTARGNLQETRGAIGNALTFYGSGTHIDLGNPGALRLQNFTVSAWANVEWNNGRGEIIGFDTAGWGVNINTNTQALTLTKENIGGFEASAGSTPIDTPVYVTAVRNGSNMSLYVNGEHIGDRQYSPSFEFNSAVHIGDRSGGGNDFEGWIDEVRVSPQIRSADWIKAQYNNQASPGAFVATGPTVSLGEESSESSSPSASPESFSDPVTLTEVAAESEAAETHLYPRMHVTTNGINIDLRYSSNQPQSFVEVIAHTNLSGQEYHQVVHAFHFNHPDGEEDATHSFDLNAWGSNLANQGGQIEIIQWDSAERTQMHDRTMAGVRKVTNNTYDVTLITQQRDWDDMEEGRMVENPVTPSLEVVKTYGPNVLLHFASPHDGSVVQIEGGGMLSGYSVNHDGGRAFGMGAVTINGDNPSGTYNITLYDRPDGVVLDQVPVVWDANSRELSLANPADAYSAEVSGSYATAMQTAMQSFEEINSYSPQDIDLYYVGLRETRNMDLFDRSAFAGAGAEAELAQLVENYKTRYNTTNVPDLQTNYYAYREGMGNALKNVISASLAMRQGQSQSAALTNAQASYNDVVQGRLTTELVIDASLQVPSWDAVLSEGMKLAHAEMDTMMHYSAVQEHWRDMDRIAAFNPGPSIEEFDPNEGRSISDAAFQHNLAVIEAAHSNSDAATAWQVQSNYAKRYPTNYLAHRDVERDVSVTAEAQVTAVLAAEAQSQSVAMADEVQRREENGEDVTMFSSEGGEQQENFAFLTRNADGTWTLNVSLLFNTLSLQSGEAETGATHLNQAITLSNESLLSLAEVGNVTFEAELRRALQSTGTGVQFNLLTEGQLQALQSTVHLAAVHLYDEALDYDEVELRPLAGGHWELSLSFNPKAGSSVGAARTVGVVLSAEEFHAAGQEFSDEDLQFGDRITAWFAEHKLPEVFQMSSFGHKLVEHIQEHDDALYQQFAVAFRSAENTRREIERLHPEVREHVQTFIREVGEQLGIQLIIADGLRSLEEQAALQGIPGPAAAPGYSYHNYGLAIDVATIRNGLLSYDLDWEAVGQIGEDLGFEWGGRWNGEYYDGTHFQMTLGLTIDQAKALHDSGSLDGEYILIPDNEND